MTAPTLFNGPRGWAEISPSGTYRHLLGRRLVPDPDLFGANSVQADRTCLFVMLNPSTADDRTDDPTIRRCCRFALRERCGVLEVVNLFAYRATDPAALLTAPDPVGYADHFIFQAVRRASIVIAAWGAIHPRLAWRAREVGADLYDHLPAHGRRGPFCLGTTAGGSPRHPLYARSDRALEPWQP